MDNDEKDALDNYLEKQITEIPLIINEELSYKNQKFNHRNDFDEITPIIDDFLDGENINRFVVLPGLRGVGKTTILYQIYEYLQIEKNINPNQILYISCDDINRMMECDIFKVIEYYLEEFHLSTLRTLDKEIFLLIDESHFDKNWSEAGKLIHDKTKKIFMVFTGSSAIKLEHESEASRRMLYNTICPLNYSQHLKLKYNYDSGNISNELFNLLFTGDISKASILERKIQTDLLNLNGYTTTDWNHYFKCGGFPAVMHEKNQRIIFKKLYAIVDAIVTRDLGTLKNITTVSENQTWRVLKFLAQKFPGDVSQNTLAQCAKTSQSNVNSLMSILEKTQLIFHYEPYVGANGRAKKSWQYYFASPSIRHAINKHFGFSSMKKEDYEGILLENLVASSLFNAKNNENNFDFDIFFELGKNTVDFLIKKEYANPIPIEVGLGTKNKRQIKKSMNKFNSDYGIIISNTTKTIQKDDDVIYIPIKTFSLM